MKKQTIHGQIIAGLLALVFVFSWSLKTAHTLFMHHKHHDVPVCEAAYNGSSSKHFHDERYNPDDCSVCAFIFAIPEIVSVPVLLQPPVLVAARAFIAPPAPFRPVEADAVRLRGPPATI